MDSHEDDPDPSGEGSLLQRRYGSHRTLLIAYPYAGDTIGRFIKYRWSMVSGEP